MKKNKYQYGFSQMHSEPMYNSRTREQKAGKIVAVLKDYYNEKIEKLTVLDIGCSTGIITHYLSLRFSNITGIDIDKPAVEYALNKWQSPNLKFYLRDAINTKFATGSFDIILCNHIYEHVPDFYQLLIELKRLLKPGGVCYFAGGHRLVIIEPHYRLPFLSFLPKSLAHLYLRLLRKGEFYYENYLTYWKLKYLVSQFFEIIDYTPKIIEDPLKYMATDMISPNSLKQIIAQIIIKKSYWLFPTYIWLLKKND